MKKRKIYITILSLITIASIIWGTVIRFGYISFGNAMNGFHFFDWKGNSVTDSYELDEFHKLYVDVSDLDITYQTGENYKIDLMYVEDEEPVIEVSNDMLSIKQDNVFFHHTYNACHIIITVPQNTEMKEVTIDAGYGDVTLNDLTAESIDMNLDMGDLEGSNLSVQKATVECNMGECDITNSALGDLSVDCNMGDIDLQKISSDKTDIECDMGEVTYVAEQTLTDKYYYQINTSLGDITYNKNEMGNKYNTDKKEGQYLMHINCDMGDIELDNM